MISIEGVTIAISVLALTVSIFVLWTNQKALATTTYLEISKRISESWWKVLEQHESSDPVDERASEIGLQWRLNDLLNLLEDTCLLSRKGMYAKLGHEMEKMIGKHLRELLTHPFVVCYIRDRVSTDEDFFREIRRFCKRNKIEISDHSKSV